MIRDAAQSVTCLRKCLLEHLERKRYSAMYCVLTFFTELLLNLTPSKSEDNLAEFLVSKLALKPPSAERLV